MKDIDFFITKVYNIKNILEGGVVMTQAVNVNFRMDKELKKNMEKVCEDMGLSMTAAFTIFAKTVSREKRIPFEVTADPFYSERNLAHLRRGVVALNMGKGIEGELLEEDK